MNNLSTKYVLLAFLLMLSAVAFAQDTTRKGYSLFKPLPKALMREEMETDRPDVTESPYTVEPGHFQYETDLARREKMHTEESVQTRWLFNQANLKLGLFKNTDLQLIVQTHGREITRQFSDNSSEAKSGFGDLTLRLKQNISGNYDGNFSIALVPYVKFPTNTFSDNKMFEEGLIVPFALKLNDTWKLGMQVEGDYLKDEDANARHAELLQTFVISCKLFKKLDVSGETFYQYNFKDHHINNFIDALLQYDISKDVKIDAGINYGLQKTAEKDYFVGLAFRY